MGLKWKFTNIDIYNVQRSLGLQISCFTIFIKRIRHLCFVSLFIYFVVSLQMQLAHFLLKEILEKLNSFRVWKNDIFAKCFIRFRYQWYSCNSGIAIFAKRVNKHFAYSLFNSFQLSAPIIKTEK